MTSQAHLLVDRADGVVTLTLNRPDRRNGVTAPLIEDLNHELTVIAASAADRVVVLTGAGGAFCSGMDLTSSIDDPTRFMRRVGATVTALHELPQPTIAKVAGAAVGFGCNLALACDLVVASETAELTELFADRGLSLDGGGSWTLPRLIGLAKAKELAFFATRLSGAEAYELGLVNRVLPDADLDAFVSAWAARLADGPSQALTSIKRALNTSLESSFAQAVEAESVTQSLAFRSPEGREGMKAFLQRRAPDFR